MSKILSGLLSSKVKSRKAVLVTGASGYLARWVVEELVEKTEFIPVLLFRESVPEQWSSREDVCALVDTGSLEKADLERLGCNVVGVIHMAARYVRHHTIPEVVKLVEANVLFGSRILELASEIGVEWFLSIGTIWQRIARPQCETVNLYAATKNAFDAILDFYSEYASFSALTLQLPDTYGPQDPRGKILDKWAESARSGVVLPMSYGLQEIDLIHAADVGKAVAHAVGIMQQWGSRRRQTYSISSGEPISLRNLQTLFESSTSLRPVLSWGDLPLAPCEVEIPVASAPVLPDWKPSIALFQGLRDSFV